MREELRRPEQMRQHVDALDAEVIQKYKPRFLAAGKDHLVFEIPGRDNVVAKVDYVALREFIKASHEHHVPMDDMVNEVSDMVKENIRIREKKRTVFQEYFRGHILREREYFGAVPISPNLVKEIYGPDHELSAEEMITEETMVPTLLSVQEKLPPEAMADDAQSLDYDYLEWKKKQFPIDAYTQLSRGLVFGETVPNIKELFLKSLSKDVRAFVKTVERNERIKKSLEDFVVRAIKYTNDTGEILDIVGDNNVIFYMKDGGVEYVLPDALDFVRDMSMREWVIQNNDEDDGEPSGPILNSLSYARLINGLALLLGIPERISFFDGIDVDFQKIYAYDK